MIQGPQVTVAGHVCLDIIPTWPAAASLGQLIPGKLIEMGPAQLSTGGAVSNTGLALHRLGLPVQLVGKLGDDAIGRAVLDLLSRAGPALADGMVIAPGEASSYSVVISPPGVDRLFLHCPGANHTFAAADVPYDRLAGQAMRLFHFGYPPLMKRIYTDGGEHLERMFARVRSLGVTTSLDMARVDPACDAGRVDWAGLLARVLPQVDLFAPSLDETLLMLEPARAAEFERAAGVAGYAAAVGIERIRELAGRLLALGCAAVALKLGDQGLYVRTTSDADRLARAGRGFALVDRIAWLGRELLAPCFAVEVAGTTGSGDCTIAGLIAALLTGLSPAESAIAATAVGACSVEQPDATSGVPTWSAVRDRIAAGWPRRPVAIPLPEWRWSDTPGVWIPM